jgi:DNA-binding transcriptional regulator YdaS (Cro superfamily)
MKERIKAVIDQIEGSNRGGKSAFCRKIGIPSGHMNSWISGKAKPNAENQASICRLYGINPHWLATGIGEMFVKHPLTSNSLISGNPLIAVHGITEHVCVDKKEYDVLLKQAGEATAYKHMVEMLIKQHGEKDR